MKRFLFSSQIQLIAVTFIILLFHLFHVLWVKQDAFTHAYDAPYWKDRIEHSQWEMPSSRRLIGDDGLFAYVGYKIAQGQDLTTLNPETGPLGKYLLGFSIFLTHTPATVSFLLGIGILLLFYLLSKIILRNSPIALLLTTLFSFDPLFYSQLAGSWVDLPQLFFLLLFFVWLFYGMRSKRVWLFLLGSGIALGLFSNVKLPVVTPFLVLLVVGYFSLQKKWSGVLSFLVGCIVGFTVPYSYYLLHHSLREFLGLQKYILAFYMQSRVHANPVALWESILVGKFPDFISGKLLDYSSWWIVLPIMAILGIGRGIILFTKKQFSFPLVLAFYTFVGCFLFSFIPFYPRYLLLVLPFFYILAAEGLLAISKKIATITLLLCIAIGVYISILSLTPNPKVVLDGFSYNLSHAYFQDIYEENIDVPQQTGFNRDSFRYIAQKAFFDAEIIQVDIKQGVAHQVSGEMQIPITEIYHTRRLGTFQEKKMLVLREKNDSWKIVWNWNLIFNNFAPSDTVKEEITSGKRGTISDKSGNILAQDTMGYLVSLNPSHMDATVESSMLEEFSHLSFVKQVGLRNAYNENPLPDTPIPLFSSSSSWDDKTLQTLAGYPGISVASYPTRVYTNFSPEEISNTAIPECCTRIYTSSTYHGVLGIEKQYDTVLSGYDGGSVGIYDANGNLKRVVTQRKAKDGRDVTVGL